MAGNTAYPSVVAQDIVDLIEANKGALDVQDVYYGDQKLIPRTPTVCVEPGPLKRDLNHTGFATDNDFTIFLLIYHDRIQDEQVTRKECMEFSEQVMDLLHLNKQMGGHVVSGWVVGIDPGFAVRNKTFYKVSRVTWHGISKTIL
jgi:hypothetical protein